jgi:hypothetical protein
MLDPMRRSLLVVLLLGACGGNVAIGDYQNSAIDARCDYLVKCGLFEDSAGCHAFYDHFLPDSPSLKAAVDLGKVKYDGEAAADCFDSVGDASCAQDAQDPGACDSIFHGTVADGGMCAFDLECVSQNCNVSDCTMACCPGTCAPTQPVPGIGQACTFDCVKGAYCAEDSTCKAVGPKGSACDTDIACASGLYCAGDTGTTSGTCTEAPKRGEACTDTCANIGDYCKDGICKAVGLLGDACTSDDDCSYYYECDGTHCITPMFDPQMPNGSACQSSLDCQSHYCGNDSLCADPPTCT